MAGEDADTAGAQPNFRLKVALGLETTLRLIQAAMQAYPDDDLETIVVLLTVAAGSASAYQRDPAVREAYGGETPLPDALRRPISRRAIAQSTGLPRETVRRRVTRLVEAGRLVEEAGGVRTDSGVMTRPHNRELAEALVRELTTAARRLARLDEPS